MRKGLFLITAVFVAVFFSSCEKKDSVTKKGLAPNDVSGMTIILSGGSRTIDFKSNSSGVIWVGNSGEAQRVRNCTYKKTSANEAEINFSWYNPNKSEPYALDETWEVTLTFSEESTGVWGGTCTYSSWSYGKQKSSNERKNYSGKVFTLKK